MSKAVLVCFRNRRLDFECEKVVKALGSRLLPDNIRPHPPHLVVEDGTLVTVLNPNDAVAVHGSSVCLGYLIEPKGRWWQPGEEAPDGTFALFRVGPLAIELVTDPAACRTIWYALTDRVFVASTSQRALVFFLQSFQPNRHVYPWMLSVGTLGPGLSWDSRIRHVAKNSALLLNRTTWELTETTERLEFDATDLPASVHEKNLRSALETVMGNLQLDPSRWVLTLSGGYDTRCILLTLRNGDGFRCVTWGLASALGDRLNDAYIADELAAHFGLEHTYFDSGLSSEDIGKMFHRFLVAGEGRIDRVGAYVDGFDMWRRMFEAGISGIVRGDGIGYAGNRLRGPFEIVQRAALGLLSDYSNLGDTAAFGLAEQLWPRELEKRESESLERWHSRLAYEYKAVTFWSALNDLKSSYVEVVNPLLSREIIDVMRQLPDSLRTEKRLLKRIVRSMGPDIPFAKRPAIANYADILKSPRVVVHVAAELNTRGARDLLSDELVDLVLSRMAVDDTKWRSISKPVSSRIRPHLVKRLNALSRTGTPKPRMDFNVMAFRAYIISRMHRMLSDDARALVGIERAIDKSKVAHPSCRVEDIPWRL
jgi:hypothetical protein